MPAAIMHVQVEGHRVSRPQMDNRLARDKLQAQLQLLLMAAHSEEESMVEPMGTEAQDQCQLSAQDAGNDGRRWCL